MTHGHPKKTNNWPIASRSAEEDTLTLKEKKKARETITRNLGIARTALSEAYANLLELEPDRMAGLTTAILSQRRFEP